MILENFWGKWPLKSWRDFQLRKQSDQRVLKHRAWRLRAYGFTVMGTRLLVVAGRKIEKVHWPKWEGALTPGLGAVTQGNGAHRE